MGRFSTRVREVLSRGDLDTKIGGDIIDEQHNTVIYDSENQTIPASVGGGSGGGGGGGSEFEIAAVSSSDSPRSTNGEDVIAVDSSSGSVTVELSSSDLQNNERIIVSDVGFLSDSNPITVEVEDSNGETITPYESSSKEISQPGASIVFQATGGDWYADVNAQLQNADIINREPLSNAQVGAITDTDNYYNEPHIIRFRDGSYITVYRQGGGHISNDGVLVQQRSYDRAETWENERTIFDVDGGDNRNQSLLYNPETDRLHMIFRVFDNSAGSNVGAFYTYTDDKGQNWEPARDITDIFAGSTVVPNVGDGIITSNGLAFFSNSSSGQVEAIFSTDNGDSWGNQTTIIDNSANGTSFSEFCPIKVTEDTILGVGRDVASTNQMFIVRSNDGGQTWSNPVTFSLTTHDAPMFAEKTAPNEITAVWGDRPGSALFTGKIGIETVLQDLSNISNMTTVKLADQRAGTDKDFSYPTFVVPERQDSEAIVHYYDGNPVIRQTGIPRGVASGGGSGGGSVGYSGDGWSNVEGSRQLESSYQNAGSSPLHLQVEIVNDGGPINALVEVGPTADPINLSTDHYHNSNSPPDHSYTVTTVVPPGHYYRVKTFEGGETVADWREYQL